MMKQWQLAHGRSLPLGEKSVIMGILNVTPDSFSDGGRYTTLDKALALAEKMLEEGATIIDVGGESTRPGGASVDAETETARVVPVIAALTERFDCLVSVDTYRVSTARLAVKAGAHIVNDVWGLQKEPEIAQVAKDSGAGLVIMHTSRDRAVNPDVIADQSAFLDISLQIAQKSGIETSHIVLDPGFGFGKEAKENVGLMARLEELQRFGYPLLVGTSRKRFIGAITGQSEPLMRDIGTAATSVAMRLAGADIFRVHNVAFNRDALAVADAILQSKADTEQETRPCTQSAS
ncbi:dihydropteroate synthase [Falsochrobactrum sp. TDYN1]|uniref:Dihydropteroate synthase n=1 Tax=Falsochrobactrum tianjinense TaxID=2706015 RepID=A0A949PNG1_9HYPH|nr:dihydropteroate synthase [Falsochrobactrum sp. TDYN1]MBV2144487.1 dihydropteroate synthase [Falsochrobactrum sp. TDYN1]